MESGASPTITATDTKGYGSTKMTTGMIKEEPEEYAEVQVIITDSKGTRSITFYHTKQPAAYLHQDDPSPGFEAFANTIIPHGRSRVDFNLMLEAYAREDGAIYGVDVNLA